MTPAENRRALAEGYVLRWLARVGRARIGYGGKLQSDGETCLASASTVLTLVQRRAIVVSGDSFTLSRSAASDAPESHR